ncbi:putative sodium-dependent transporter YocR [Acropora cervicornis]|uniref:Sodium-dependent transporter YocR n=1 Tax=Acropora cervicornis TaxID=6130 RepID=A0AAD9PRQ5_ACRCE|nr:putative sodium-dependent transporter YocR [Acropora cervicornis]
MTSQEHSPLVRAYSSSSENQNYNNERFEQLAHFSGKWGLVFSCLGCVVGTGNIWRFPRIVANNSGKQGGLQFLLVWLIYLMLWSIPVIITEYTVGRYTRHAPVKSFRVLLGPWSLWCGGWMVAVVVLIASYYSVVVGWCYYYLFHSIFYALPKSKQESTDIWKHLQTSQYLPVLLHFLSLLFTSLSLIKGVSSIEKVNRVIVPLLLLVLLVSFYWSLTLEYASYGITFLFTPDWGAGSGLFLTYASYMTRRDGVVKLGTLLPAANNVISLLSAIMLYSTVFSTKMKEGVNQTEIATLLTEDGYANTGLTFQWMPVLYSELRIPGRILSCLFFLCLSLAGGTSLVALLELPIHTLEEMRSGCSVFGLEDWTLPSIWDYIIKFIDPLIAVFLIVSFVIDTVQDERTEWYEIKRESLMTCLVEWLVVLILLVLTNALWMYRRRTRRRIHRISSIRDARPRVFTNEEMN